MILEKVVTYSDLQLMDLDEVDKLNEALDAWQKAEREANK
ncbi:hypothetical protein [Caudoviricetes sp.]|nr:hypothetical protein [Caudoviricetes sp.]